MKRIVLFILIIFLPLLLLLQSVEVNTFNRNIYIDSYKKYGVMDTTGRNINELKDITNNLLEYLESGLDKEILSPFFNEREIQHMEDVKVLFKHGFKLRNIALILTLTSLIAVILWRDYRYFFKGLFYGICGWWGFFILLFILSTLDFTKYFTYFHLIFFDNDLWILNPRTDLLIQMLPEEFFIHIFRRIVLLFIGKLAIIQLVAYILMKKENKGNGRIMEG